jgi:hypothetical protein
MGRSEAVAGCSVSGQRRWSASEQVAANSGRRHQSCIRDNMSAPAVALDRARSLDESEGFSPLLIRFHIYSL